MLWHTLHGFDIRILWHELHLLKTGVSGQSVAQFAFPQTLNAHACPARRQLRLGTLKVRANFCLTDAVKAGTAHDPPLPQAHHPTYRNEGYKLPGTGTWALLPSVNPQVPLNRMHQPIHGESPMLAKSRTRSCCVRLTVSHKDDFQTFMDFKVIKGRSISSSARPSEEITEKHEWTISWATAAFVLLLQ